VKTLRTRCAIVVAVGQVTYFNIPLAAEGYAYAAGPTVVIAYNTAGASEGATAQDPFTKIPSPRSLHQDPFTKILDRLH
jgi:hypothetical protein